MFTGKLLKCFKFINDSFFNSCCVVQVSNEVFLHLTVGILVPCFSRAVLPEN